MATKLHGKTGGCTFQWKIDNIRHCWLKKGEKIDSPRFIADALNGTKWFLRLYPSGYTNENEIGFYLRREQDCVGPESIQVNYQLVILDKDSAMLEERMETERSYTKNCSFGFFAYEKPEKVFVTQREVYLPNDTLTLQCIIWNTNERPAKMNCLHARTVYKVNRKNFAWRIDEFSSLKCSPINQFKDDLIEFDLTLTEGLEVSKKLVMNLNSFKETLKYFSFKAFVVDSGGRKENFGTNEYFADNLKRGKLCTLLMKNESLYLRNDVLSLYCECVYSGGVVLYEKCGYGLVSLDVTDGIFDRRNEHDIDQQEILNTTVLSNDFKLMYNSAIFSDTKIRTLTQTFSAHKAVLSARSPVFRGMFSNDMKEKNSGYVDITDFEDDTMQLMLLYMYTDSLEELNSERTLKLYVAADKYEILSLKSRCSSFLKASLSPNCACAVLILADQHQDTDLKCFVQNYILENYKEVLCSEEWKDFMNTDIKLAADVMYQFSQCKINAT